MIGHHHCPPTYCSLHSIGLQLKETYLPAARCLWPSIPQRPSTRSPLTFSCNASWSPLSRPMCSDGSHTTYVDGQPPASISGPGRVSVLSGLASLKALSSPLAYSTALSLTTPTQQISKALTRMTSPRSSPTTPPTLSTWLQIICLESPSIKATAPHSLPTHTPVSARPISVYRWQHLAHLPVTQDPGRESLSTPISPSPLTSGEWPTGPAPASASSSPWQG